MQPAYLLTRIFAVISVILVIEWITGGSLDTTPNISNLGGLYPINMSDSQSNNYNYVRYIDFEMYSLIYFQLNKFYLIHVWIKHIKLKQINPS